MAETETETYQLITYQFYELEISAMYSLVIENDRVGLYETIVIAVVMI